MTSKKRKSMTIGEPGYCTQKYDTASLQCQIAVNDMLRIQLNHSSLACMAVLPVALLSSCSNSEDYPADISHQQYISSDFHILSAGNSSIDCNWIDIFAYDESDGGKLDSYQRVSGRKCSVQTTAGPKKIAAIANLPDSSFDYSDIVSYGKLKEMMAEFRNDNPSVPLMSGEFILEKPGPGRTCTLELTPVMSRIFIRNFEVDFSARPYRNETLTDTKAYLVNVNGMCRIMADSTDIVSEIINYGQLDLSYARQLAHPECVCSDRVEKAELYCYPCPATSGQLGSCTTRLVIEGKIRGRTYYYPIDIGVGGVERGKSYVFDITITRSGTLSPDIPVESDMLKVQITENGWKEYENENIEF